MILGDYRIVVIKDQVQGPSLYKCDLYYYDVLVRIEFTPMHYSQPRLQFIFLLHSITIDTMHPLLEDVLNEPRLAATSPYIAIVLLPPIDTMPSAPCTLDFLGKAKALSPFLPHYYTYTHIHTSYHLASHVIVTMWDPTVENTPSATAMPRPSLSASMLSRLSPKSTRRERSNSILNGLRTRSKSTLHDGNGGLSLSTVNNKPILFHNRKVTIGANRTITIHHEDLVYNADDRVTHLLLYIEQPLDIQQETGVIVSGIYSWSCIHVFIVIHA